MAIVTLTTDWGLKDHYLAAFKGELLSKCPAVTLIDISHEVDNFNVVQASFLLKNSFHYFAPGTIHYIGMSGQGSPNHPEFHKDYLIVTSCGNYFVGVDSGIFSLILGDNYEAINRLPLENNQRRDTILAGIMEVLCSLVHGRKPIELGSVHPSLNQSFLPEPTIDTDNLRGTVIYIDSFGNAIVNIKRELFDRELKGRRFTIFLRKSKYDIQRISFAYEEAAVGDIVALFNRENYLEIAINRDSAAGLLGIKFMDAIRIEFHDH